MREGLQRIGILDADELAGLERELDVLAEDFRSGRFVLDEQYEDGHSAIEARLVERLGDAGRKIHTGRSRNDQILVATRLWLKDRLARVAATCRESAQVALARAEAEGATAAAGLHPPATRGGVLRGHVVGGLGRRLHRRCAARAADAGLGRCQSARQRRRLRRQPAAGARPHHARRSGSAACRCRRPMRSCRAASSRWRRSKRCRRRCSTCAAWPGT